MSDELTLSLSSEKLDLGSTEERATFGSLVMTANGRLLTAVEDVSRGEILRGPRVAGYSLAEWLVWNWWRIRWEFGRPSESSSARDWDFAHRMSAVGDGYDWPRIEIFSDGPRSYLASEPSRDAGVLLFRYISTAGREEVPANSLDDAVDGFVGHVLARIEDEGVRDSNLHRLWRDLDAERGDRELSRFRKLEAQLGCDPDEADEAAMRNHLEDASAFGDEAWGEVAADPKLRGGRAGYMMSAQEIVEIARRKGFDADWNDAVSLSDREHLPPTGTVKAWQVGHSIADSLRNQEDLNGQPITDEQLSALTGTSVKTISQPGRDFNGISFSLTQDEHGARVALGPKWKTGRRFWLARLLGGRLFGQLTDQPVERLLPATRTYSYRQKVQRAFAAEFLSPFSEVDDMLGGDYSEESQFEAATRFDVSPLLIQTQLVNHGRIDRDDAPGVVFRGRD